jgi:hypothetical protein
MPSVDINWLALIAAVAVNMVVGFVWYSPALFAKQWAKLTGRKMEEMGDGTKGYVLTTAGAFVQAFILLHLVSYAAYFYPTYSEVSVGLLTAVYAWIGFVAIPQGVNTVFAGTRKKLLAINTGYFLVVLLINGVLLSVWK